MAPRVRAGGSGQPSRPPQLAPETASPPNLNGATADDARLLALAAAGDPDAQAYLFTAYSGLVSRAARARDGVPLGYDDLYQEASLGLVEAIHSFSGPEVAAFVTFAKKRIEAQIDAALAVEQHALEEARRLLTAATDYETAELNLARELKRPPTQAELAVRLEWSTVRTRQIADIVAEARRRQDEELLQYLDPDPPTGKHKANGNGS